MSEFTALRGDLSHDLMDLLGRYDRIEHDMEEQHVLLGGSRP